MIVNHVSSQLNNRLLLLALAVLVIFVASGCDPGDPPSPTPTPYQISDIDPILREFYSHLGGEQRLGPAISAPIVDGSKTIQYMETCKLIYDNDALPTQHFRVAPLGVQMDLREPPVPPPSNPAYRYCDGHTIHPDFLPMYETLGAKVVGCPITEARFSLVYNRYEQFFENFGFYREEGETQVRLMPYGLWACAGDRACESKELYASYDSYRSVNPTFIGFVEKYGADLTGFALTEAHLNKDGFWQQIFENVVLIADSEGSPETARMLPVPEKLGLLPDQPQPYSGNPETFFYTAQGNDGYEIPIYFWNYMLQHGGIDFFGPPIQHLAEMDKQIYRQCYNKLCLLYDPKAVEGAEIRPEPLGYSFKVLYKPEKPVSTPTPEIQPTEVQATFEFPTATPQPEIRAGREIILQVWETNPMLSAGQIQEIGVIVLDWDLPLPNISPELYVEIPDSKPYYLTMPPTRNDGMSHAKLAPIDAPNGALVEYKVCIRASDADKFCVRESFMIWDSP
jgi:hypothetical protein